MDKQQIIDMKLALLNEVETKVRITLPGGSGCLCGHFDYCPHAEQSAQRNKVLAVFDEARKSILKG